VCVCVREGLSTQNRKNQRLQDTHEPGWPPRRSCTPAPGQVPLTLIHPQAGAMWKAGRRSAAGMAAAHARKRESRHAAAAAFARLRTRTHLAVAASCCHAQPSRLQPPGAAAG
jgi:hypothetical protein